MKFNAWDSNTDPSSGSLLGKVLNAVKLGAEFLPFPHNMYFVLPSGERDGLSVSVMTLQSQRQLWGRVHLTYSI